MTAFSLQKLLLRSSILLVSILLGACGAPIKTRAQAEWIESKRVQCSAPQGTCAPFVLREMSLETLRLKGAEMRVDCDLEFIDYSEETAREACGENVSAVFDALQLRWPGQLKPVAVEQMTFELEDQGCISLTNGYCACTYAGVARVPLQWITPQ